MNRLLIAAILWAGMAQAGWALSVEDRLLAGLESQGYTILEKGYTFLGRLRIVAENAEIHREIVVNPGTGEVLRDYAIYIADMPQNPPAAMLATRDGNSGRSSRASGGTAGVAASTLPPGTTTLGSASLQVDTTRDSAEMLLVDPILPVSPGKP